jgi:FMN hydrolase / 5-amino-6-(5-phospho-D-ribitylamino)uracil phosphatase
MTVVFFDGDQTLWDFESVMRRALGETIDELRSIYPDVNGALSVDSLIADRQAAASLTPSETDMERLRRAAFVRTLERIGLHDTGLADRLTSSYLERRFAPALPYPDVVPALKELGSRHRLGLLSNGNSRPEHFGIGDLFEIVLFADDVGHAKPDRRLFEAAAALAGAGAPDCAMVGDSVDNDVIGAQRAGWVGIWLNRAGVRVPDHATPDATITSLADAVTALEELTAP